MNVYELEVAKYHLVEEESSEMANDAQVQCRRRLPQQDSNSPHPPKNYMEGVQVRTQEWLPGHQAHHRAESRLRNTGRAGGGASFLLSQIKIAQRASPRLWGFVKGTMDTCAYLHCLGIQPEPCFPVFSNAKENSARAFHRREALM